MTRVHSFLLLLSLLSLCCLVGVQALRFGGAGTLSWSLLTSPGISPPRWSVNVDLALARSSYNNPALNAQIAINAANSPGDVSVSQTVNAGPCCGKPSTDPCYAANPSLPGSGCGMWTSSLPLTTLQVVAAYPDDQMLSRLTTSFALPNGFANDQPLSVAFTTCCRIDTLAFSAGSGVRIEAIIAPKSVNPRQYLTHNLDTQGHVFSPRVVSTPRVYLPVGTNTFQLYGLSPQVWTRSFRLAAGTPDATGFVSSWPSTIGSSAVNAATGVVTIVSSVARTAQMQVIVQTTDPTNTAAGPSSTAMDLTIVVLPGCAVATKTCKHFPVFEPVVPATTTFTPGTVNTMVVVARNDDIGGPALELFASALPDGASFTFVSVAVGKNAAANYVNYTSYALQWTPPSGALFPSFLVCFSARSPDTLVYNTAQACTTVVSSTLNNIAILQGTFRDFHSSVSAAGGVAANYLSDFNRPEASVDNGLPLVQTTLNPVSGLPVWAGVAAASVASAASFGQWWRTDTAGLRNAARPYDVLLTNSSLKTRFKFDSGTTWWPLDNQLFGIENDAANRNRFFTLELHSSLTYMGGESLVFESSDDLFVFVGGRLPSGWSMAGIVSTQVRTFTLSLDTHFLAADKGSSFPIDIFYAHRSATSVPLLRLTLVAPTLCVAVPSANAIPVILSSVPAQLTGVKTVGVAAVSGGNVNLVPGGGTTLVAGAAWWTVNPSTGAVSSTAQRYNLAHGFEALFSFSFPSGLSEGFAFVMQADSGAALGSSGLQLGYGGALGLKNSLAVEFDAVNNVALGDPAYQHVSIHSRFDQANDANEASRVPGSSASVSGFKFTFENGTVHQARVVYIPGAPRPLGGSGRWGKLLVYVGSNGGQLSTNPVATASLDALALDRMWAGSAFVGFTAGASNVNKGAIRITSFQLNVVPPVATESFALQLPGDMTAGTVGQMIVQLADACGNARTSGGEAASLQVTLSHPSINNGGVALTLTVCASGTVCGANTIEDRLDGSYLLRYSPIYANRRTDPWRIAVQYKSPIAGSTFAPIQGSPFAFNVEAGVASAAQSTFALSYNTLHPSGNPRAGMSTTGTGAGSIGTATVYARDQWGNPCEATTDSFSLVFDPQLAGINGGSVSAFTKLGYGTSAATFSTSQALTFSVYVRLDRDSNTVAGSPQFVTFVPGFAVAAQSSATGPGLSATVAGELGTFHLYLRDAAGNDIVQAGGDNVCDTVASLCRLVASTVAEDIKPYRGGILTGLPARVNVPILCSWIGQPYMSCSFNATVAYAYLIQMRVNTLLMPSLAAPMFVVVAPTDLSPRNCRAQFPGGTLTAGFGYNTVLQQRDRFDNNLQLPLPAGVSWKITWEPTTRDTGYPKYGVPTSNVPVYQLAFGVYYSYHIPRLAGQPGYIVNVTMPGSIDPSANIITTPWSYNSIPYRAAPPSIMFGVTSGLTVNATASLPYNFTILSRDGNNNTMYMRSNPTDFFVTLTDRSTGRVLLTEDISAVESLVEDKFSMLWGTQVAGNYIMKVTSWSAAGLIVGSGTAAAPLYVNVLPLETSTPNCTATGPGVVGGVIGDTVRLTVTAQDIFGNVQLGTVTDSFRAIVQSGNATGSVTLPLARLKVAPFTYYVDYVVPLPFVGGHIYRVLVQRDVGTGVWANLTGSPFTANAVTASGSLYVTLAGAGATEGKIGSTATFNVTERDGATGSELPGGVFLTVTIASVAQSGGQPMQFIPDILVSAEQANATYLVSYTPSFTFPQGNPNFLVTISRGNSKSLASLATSSVVMTPSPYPLFLRAGPVYGPMSVVQGVPPTVVAGSVANFSVLMRDTYSNAVTDALSFGTVTATLVPLGEQTPPLPTITLTATQSATDQTQYIFAARLNVSATYVVSVFYTTFVDGLTQTLGSANDASQLTVTAGPASARTTLVQANAATPLPSGNLLFDPLTAGVTATFTVLLKDDFGNSVDLPTPLPAGLLSFAIVPDGSRKPSFVPTFGAPQDIGSSGVYTVTLVTYRSSPGAAATATPFLLQVNVSGKALPAARAPLVRVVAAEVSTASSVSGTEGTTVAGQDFVFTLTAVDRFGNPVQLAGTGALQVQALDSKQRRSVCTFASTATEGVYLITWPAASTVVTGVYTFELLSFGQAFLSAVPSVIVVPGVVDAARTDVPPFIGRIRAGEVTTVTLGLRDAFFNEVDNLSQADLLRILTLNFPIDFGNDPCSTSATDRRQFADASFANVSIVGVGARANISFIPTLVGSFALNVSLGGTPLDCTRLARLAFVVTPGAEDPATSRVLLSLGNVTAGAALTLSVAVFDRYGNQLDTTTSAVMVGYPFFDAAPYFSPYITTDPSQWLHNTSAVLPARSSSGLLLPGRYENVLYPTLVGTRQVVVTLNGYLVATYNPAGVPVPPLVTVQPNVPVTWSVVDELPGAPAKYAGTPFSILLAVRDVYGNLYTRDDSALSMDIRAVVGEYAFTGVVGYVGGGQFQWLATSAFPGRVSVTIKLLVGPDAGCVALDPLTPFRCSDQKCRATTCPDVGVAKDPAIVTVLPTTCAALDASKPFRCPDSSCVARYADCPGINMCPAGTPVRCATDPSQCVRSAEQCPCDNLSPSASLLERCSSGTCVAKDPAAAAGQVNPLCHPTVSCAGSTFTCRVDNNDPTSPPAGECRADASQCPSHRVCSPGWLACADGHSCARSLSECVSFDTPASGCPLGSFRCALGGRCTSSLAECPTAKTCPSGSVLCLADGSCAASASQCPDQYKCWAPTPFRCADGSCRVNATGCPSQSTCASGWVKCENGACAQSLAACLPAVKCPPELVRCGNGACVGNVMMCAAQATCPLDSPVLCSDTSCVSDASLCLKPRVCPSTGSIVCPDGSCTSNVTQLCPTTLACPPGAPVLCADLVSCASDISQCVAPSGCPVVAPMRCPDGSCRGTLVDCPSRSSCPASKSVRCADGGCVKSSEQCNIVSACTGAAPFRCPGGECVATSSLCPTHVTCPVGSSRCGDGSCRASCAELPPQESCAVGLFACPLPCAGQLCVPSLAQCPLSFICPPSLPVRCMDTSCASSVSACPPLPPPSLPEKSKGPCPDGSWVTDQEGCNTPASCPANMPFKCADETCRAAPGDCPVPTRCTDPAKPHRCVNGACAASPYDAACRLTTFQRCPTETPVKCPGVEDRCVNDVRSCAVSLPTAPDQFDRRTWAAACPPQWAQCRDGTCREAASSCPDTQCPLSLPFLCANGVCALNAKTCPDALTGCRKPMQFCSTTGACVSNADDETQCPSAGPDCFLACSDGFCLSTANIKSFNSICRAHQCLLRCADRTCGMQSIKAGTNLTAATPGNMCTLPGTPDPGNAPLLNQCPPYAPFKCGNGLCALSHLACISVSVAGSAHCPPDRPIECANAECVVAEVQCAALYPCSRTEMRCGDGSCRERQASDTGNECRAWGIANTCPLVDPTDPSSGQRYRCDSGLCAVGTTADTCIDLSIGCPPPGLTRCPNGACIPTARFGGFLNQEDLCEVPALQPAAVGRLANGCSATERPYKCPYSGHCVANMATECTNSAGCLFDKPFRCDAEGQDGACVDALSKCQSASPTCFRCADGSCAANDDPSQCRMLNGCNVTEPILCASGDCRALPAGALLRGLGVNANQTCPPTATCLATEEMCYDGSCVPLGLSALCPAVTACLAPNTLCSDRSCVSDASECKVGACPAAVPILCDDGACVADVSSCSVSSSYGAGTGTGLLGTILAQNSQQDAVAAATGLVTGPNVGAVSLPSAVGRCSAAEPIECFDGQCVVDFAACRTRAIALRGGGIPSASSSALANITGGCPAEQIMCPQGDCTPDPLGWHEGLSNCKLIPACGNGFYRCESGACVSDPVECAPVAACGLVTFPAPSSTTAYKPMEMKRCQDGLCRFVCPPFDGCPAATAPYQCTNRECAPSPNRCQAAAQGGGFDFSTVKLTLTPPPQLVAVAPAANMRRRLLSSWSGKRLQHPISSAAEDMSTLSLLADSDPNEAPADNSASASGSGGPQRCFSNCASEVKAYAYTTLLDVSTARKLVVATDATRREVMWLTVPAGAMQFAPAAINTTTTTSTRSKEQRVSISISPVGEALARVAENRVPSSRKNVSESGFLSFAGSVLSPMFSLGLDPGVQLPLLINLTLSASIDLSVLTSQLAAASAAEVAAWPTAFKYRDICLAKLYELPAIGFAAWQCLYTCTTGAAADPVPTRCAVRDGSSTGDASIVSGSVGEPGIYAFVEAPVAAPAEPAELSWVQRNALYLFLGLSGAAIVVFFVFYGAQRLHRYRRKYKEEADRVAKEEEEVNEMELHGGAAGVKDDEVTMLPNPLVTQMKAMQARIDTNAIARKEEETKQKEMASEARAEHIAKLDADRAALAAQLAVMQAQAKEMQADQQSIALAPVSIEMSVMDTVGGGGAGGFRRAGVASSAVVPVGSDVELVQAQAQMDEEQRVANANAFRNKRAKKKDKQQDSEHYGEDEGL